MIKEKAKELLNKLKGGTGSTTIFGSSYYDEETRKIIEVATNECKSTVITEDGKQKRYESDLSINNVREVIEQLLSDKNSIKGSLVGRILTQRGIPGLVKEVKVAKRVNEKGIPYLDINKPFPDDFEKILIGKYNEAELFKKVIKPYISRVCKQAPQLSKKHRFTRLFSPFGRKEVTDTQLIENYSKYLSDNTNLDEEKIDNMSKYFIYHILGNKDIMQSLVDDEIQGTSLEVLGENKKTGYSGMLQNMSNNLVDILGGIENPNNKLKEVENIYANLTGELEALSIEFDENPVAIEEEIININRIINRNRQQFYADNGYRTINVTFGKKDAGLLRKEHVPEAMKLYSEEISELMTNADNLNEEEYIRQVAKLHFRFIQIHPFPDGNGRTGRAISNVLLSKKNLCAVFDKTSRNEYIGAMTLTRNLARREANEYTVGLYTGQSICNEIEDKYVDKLEEFIGINLLGKDELYKDRDITAELPVIGAEQKEDKLH